MINSLCTETGNYWWRHVGPNLSPHMSSDCLLVTVMGHCVIYWGVRSRLAMAYQTHSGGEPFPCTWTVNGTVFTAQLGSHSKCNSELSTATTLDRCKQLWQYKRLIIPYWSSNLGDNFKIFLLVMFPLIYSYVITITAIRYAK